MEEWKKATRIPLTLKVYFPIYNIMKQYVAQIFVLTLGSKFGSFIVFYSSMVLMWPMLIDVVFLKKQEPNLSLRDGKY